VKRTIRKAGGYARAIWKVFLKPGARTLWRFLKQLIGSTPS
jgi:hypothetical protein